MAKICLDKEQVIEIKNRLKKLHSENVDIKDAEIVYAEFFDVIKDEKTSIDFTEKYLKYLVNEDIKPILKLVKDLYSNTNTNEIKTEINPKYLEIKKEINKLKTSYIKSTPKEKIFIKKQLQVKAKELSKTLQKITPTEAQLQQRLEKTLQTQINTLQQNVELLKQGKEIPTKEKRIISVTDEIRKLQEEKVKLQDEFRAEKLKPQIERIRKGEDIQKEIKEKQERIDDKLLEAKTLRSSTIALRELFSIELGVELSSSLVEEYMEIKRESDEWVSRMNQFYEEAHSIYLSEIEQEGKNQDKLNERKKEIEQKILEQLTEGAVLFKKSEEFIKNNNINGIDLNKFDKVLFLSQGLALSVDISVFFVQLPSMVFTRDFWRSLDLTKKSLFNSDVFHQQRAKLLGNPYYKEYVRLGGISTFHNRFLGFEQDLQNNPFAEVDLGKTFGKLGKGIDAVLEKSSQLFSLPAEYVRFNQYYKNIILLEAYGHFKGKTKEEIKEIKKSIADIVNTYSGASLKASLSLEGKNKLDGIKLTNRVNVFLFTSLRKLVANIRVGLQSPKVVANMTVLFAKHPDLLNPNTITNFSKLTTKEAETLYKAKRLASLMAVLIIFKSLAALGEEQEWDITKPDFWRVKAFKYKDDEGKKKVVQLDPTGGALYLFRNASKLLNSVTYKLGISKDKEATGFGKSAADIIDSAFFGRKGILLGNIIDFMDKDAQVLSKQLKKEKDLEKEIFITFSMLIQSFAPTPLSLGTLKYLDKSEKESNKQYNERLPASIISILLGVIGVGSTETTFKK